MLGNVWVDEEHISTNIRLENSIVERPFFTNSTSSSYHSGVVSNGSL
jgi:hypothetical protein